MIGLIVLGYGPILYAMIYYFKDVWRYLTVGKTEDIQLWQVNYLYNQWIEILWSIEVNICNIKKIIVSITIYNH